MPPLAWNHWGRTDGCRYHMDQTKFAGSTFSEIFWDAMRRVFMDELNQPGYLYREWGWKASEEVVRLNFGRRAGFSVGDQVKMLRKGDFKYLPFLQRLSIEGPDQEHIDCKCSWGAAMQNGTHTAVDFYGILNAARTGEGFGFPLPEDDIGRAMVGWFTVGTLFHEMTHNHGFDHPGGEPDYTPGSDFAASLPHVAKLAVLLASPYARFFVNMDFIRPLCQQGGWRYCRKCNGLFLEDFGPGVCPASGGHDKTGSFDYSITHRLVLVGQEPGWKFCNKCQGLFLAGTGLSAGVCAAGGSHNGQGSWEYSVSYRESIIGHEPEWHLCKKCQGIFLERMGPGACPVGGGHDIEGPSDYSLFGDWTNLG
jgi:hypothetical protein